MYNLSDYFGDFRVAVTTQSISAGPAVRVLPPSPYRVALLVGNFTGNALYIATYGGFSQGTGQFIVPVGDNMGLLWKDVGILVTLEWWGLTQTTTGNATFTEIFWQPTEGQC